MCSMECILPAVGSSKTDDFEIFITTIYCIYIYIYDHSTQYIQS